MSLKTIDRIVRIKDAVQNNKEKRNIFITFAIEIFQDFLNELREEDGEHPIEEDFQIKKAN